VYGGWQTEEMHRGIDEHVAGDSRFWAVSHAVESISLNVWCLEVQVTTTDAVLLAERDLRLCVRDMAATSCWVLKLLYSLCLWSLSVSIDALSLLYQAVIAVWLAPFLPGCVDQSVCPE
jgi:hypothetical protein